MNLTLHEHSILYKRIERVGAIGRTFCTLILVFNLLAAFALVAYCFQKNKEIGMVPLFEEIFWNAGILLMRQLFVRLARQELFAPASGRLIQWLGIWQFIWGIRFNAKPQGADVYNFQITDGLVLNCRPELVLTGLFLLALGWGMTLAASLKQEQDLTV